MTETPVDPTTRPPRPDEPMLTFRSGGWVILLAVLIVVGIAGWRTWVIVSTYEQRAIGDGVTVESYQFSLDNLLVERDRMRPISRSLRRDGLPVMDNPPKVSSNVFREESRAKTDDGQPLPDDKIIHKLGKVRKLLPDDRVLGVSINGESVAYPIWILDWHEIVNDTVGGKPILVTYNAVCDSAIAFDPVIDGQLRRFGFSGLIYNSNLLMYDRGEAETHEPSLWCQLQMRAICGPLAGTQLQPLPLRVMEWKDWFAAHPETTVLLPQPGRKRVYKRKAYNTYLRDDELKFPVEPLPTDGRPYKTRVVAVLSPEGQWDLMDPSALDADPTLNERPHVYSFWFAWHALRSELP